MNAKIYNRQAITPRSRNWQQIEVSGEHASRLRYPDGTEKPLVQVIDGKALEAIVANFQAEAADPYFDGMLVDADHLSHDPDHKTESYAWLMNVEIREGELWGELEWTDLGAAAVHGRRFKYFSSEYNEADLEEVAPGRVRPLRLAGLALTNRPNNKGGRPITNRAANPDDPAGRQPNPTDEPKTKMKSIAMKLGLAEDATEEDILAAIDALQAKETESEVETILNRHKGRFADDAARAKWKTRLIANRENEEILAELPDLAAAKKEETAGRPAITNRETAKVPDASQAHGDDGKADEAKAARIRNRAHEIDKADRCGWRAAFQRATAEIG